MTSSSWILEVTGAALLGYRWGGPTVCVTSTPHTHTFAAGGPDELAPKFSDTSIMYGLCRIQDPGTGAHRVVLINWVSGEAGGGWGHTESGAGGVLVWGHVPAQPFVPVPGR